MYFGNGKKISVFSLNIIQDPIPCELRRILSGYIIHMNKL